MPDAKHHVYSRAKGDLSMLRHLSASYGMLVHAHCAAIRSRPRDGAPGAPCRSRLPLPTDCRLVPRGRDR